MRITGGTYKGRTLLAGKGAAVRPTTDMARQGIFNMLSSRMDLVGCTVLDLYAGSGALGLEALSRGAYHCLFTDISAQSLKLVQHNCNALGLSLHQAQESSCEKTARLQKADGRYPQKLTIKQPVHLVLIDPPYDQGLEEISLCSLQACPWLASDALIVVERSCPFSASPFYHKLVEKNYGRSHIVILSPAPSFS